MAAPPRKEFAWQRKQREEAERLAAAGGGYSNMSSAPPPARREFAWEKKAREQAAYAAASHGSGPVPPPPISTGGPPQKEFAWQRRAREEAERGGGGGIASPSTPATPQKEFAWQRRAREEAMASGGVTPTAQRRHNAWEKKGPVQPRLPDPEGFLGGSKAILGGELFRFLFFIADLVCLIKAVNKLGGLWDPRKDEVWVYTALSFGAGTQLILFAGFAKARRDAREVKAVYILSLLLDFISALIYLGAFIWVSTPIGGHRDDWRREHPKTDENSSTWKDYQTTYLEAWKFNMMLWQFIIQAFVFFFIDIIFACWGVRQGKILRGEIVV